MHSHHFISEVLRENDIRGTVGVNLSVEDARALGWSFGSVILRRGSEKHPRVVVGYDGRLSSPSLADGLIAGFQDVGLDVTCIGCGPSPMLYFAVHDLEAAGGVIVTGSHNPPDQNGFKLMLGKQIFYGEDIRRLGEMAAKGDFASAEQRGQRSDLAFKTRYVDRLLRGLTLERPLRVAWDPGNGAAGEVVAALAARLPGSHHMINTIIDGRFPSHHPDPTVPANLQQLQQLVQQQQCDLGLAFDGDGDRIGVIDQTGAIIWGDQLLALLARDVLRRLPGATIIADVKASQAFFDDVERHGGKPLMWKTGHAFIKTKMQEVGSPLAGEMSAHIFFADDYYGFDDALYVALRFLRIAAAAAGGAKALRESLPLLHSTPEIRIECGEQLKFSLIDALRKHLVRRNVEYIAVDGVRVQSGSGWWLLRASNTQPILVARAEASSQDGLRGMLDEIQENLAACGFAVPAETLAL